MPFQVLTVASTSTLVHPQLRTRKLLGHKLASRFGFDITDTITPQVDIYKSQVTEDQAHDL